MSADDLTASDVDQAVRVHVCPAQASYFAGEQFAVTITFTNTRSPESPKVRHSHRRGVHSISSAPLARPPTSPGIPRPTPLAAPVNHARDVPARKRLIGQGKSDMSLVLEQKRQSLLEKSRSLSIDIPASDLPKPAEPADDGASRYVRAYNEFSDAAPTMTPSTSASTLTRSPDFQLPPHHPHARKQSVTDVHIHVNSVQQPSPQLPPPASTSGSTFSLALDPIAETPSTPYPGTPLPRSPSLTDTLKIAPPPRRPPQFGLGHGPPPPPALRNGAFVASNSELILYSYAQLLGTVSITPLPGVTMTPEHAHALAALRRNLAKRAVVGGGSMDIAAQQTRPRRHGRSASLTSSFLALWSPGAPSTSSQSLAPGRSRASSASSGHVGGQQNGIGLGLIDGGVDEEVDPDAPLPTFDVQPAMLAVDLLLGPGESRTYTYTVTLPDNLPPTFRGRALKFSYELVIGTCRASASAMRSMSNLGPTGANSISRVMKVPIRVYNHVAVGRVPRPYDLLWPVGRRDYSVETAPKVVEGAARKDGSQNRDRSRCLDELREYGRRLGSLAGPEGMSPVQTEFELERDGDGTLTGCREAVEILTRNPKKVSYDVNKDGVKVAVLTMAKSGYRLGETVLGVVELNERRGRTRVLSLSAMLESQETLPGGIASGGNLRHMRRVHAEHHASQVSCVLRTTFSLDIPSDASPAFQVALGETGAGIAGGLLWRVRLTLLVAVAGETSGLRQMGRAGPTGEWGTAYRAYATIAPKERTERARTTSTWTGILARTILGERQEEGEAWTDVAAETVECEVPIRVWPGNTAFNAMEVPFEL